MRKHINLAKAVKLASATMIMGAVMLPLSLAQAEEEWVDAPVADEEIEEVFVTGSAIKRKDLSSSMPVQQFSAEDIAQTGALDAAELMQKLPAMQGFTTAGDSVGGDGGGVVSADIHGIGEQYTLVLVNGRRIAPSGSDGTIDISHIPVSIIQSVEVLTDGASALYGSDAISGVVNFILKDQLDQVTVSARVDVPTEGGGEQSRFDISGGFGDREKHGFNVVATYSHVDEKALASTERDYAETGFITFNPKGDNDPANRDAFFFNGSPNAIPGNAFVNALVDKQFAIADSNNLAPDHEDWDPTYEIRQDSNGNTIQTTEAVTYNPYRIANGECAENTTSAGNWCEFDYTGTLNILPEKTTDSAFVGIEFDITENIEGYSELLLSRRSMTSRIAPTPTGLVSVSSDVYNAQMVAGLQSIIAAGSAVGASEAEIDAGLTAQTALTQLAAGGAAYEAPETLDQDDEDNGAADAQAGAFGVWRALPAGNRTTEYNSDAMNFVLGARGMIEEMEFDASFTHSTVEQEERRVAGWLRDAEFAAAMADGLDVFKSPSEWTEADQAKLDDAIYNGLWGEEDTTQTALNFNASMPAFSMSGGEAIVAFGVDAYANSYEDKPSQDNLDTVLLNVSEESAFDLERKQAGMFSELYMPVTDTAEVTASLRYDYISGMESEGTEISDSLDDFTYKISGKWEAVEDLVAIRGAIGTGFKAPDMLAIGIPVRKFGVTSDVFACPFEESDPRKNWCVMQATGEAQAQVYEGGNTELKPEQSTQWTIGAVITPTEDINIVIDLWNIEITDQIDTLTEKQIFDNPVLYSDKFTTWNNPATGQDELAIIKDYVNIGKKESRGIDYRFDYTIFPEVGEMTFTLQGTHVLEQDSSLYGSSLGQFGSDENVVFEDLLKVSVALKQDSMAHVVTVNYQSGYTDQTQEVEYLDANGDLTGETFDYTGEVPSHVTVDYQGQFQTLEDALTLTFGVENVMDEEPPLTLRTSGAGHQLGFDPRYYDARGRTAYLEAAYSF